MSHPIKGPVDISGQLLPGQFSELQRVALPIQRRGTQVVQVDGAGPGTYFADGVGGWVGPIEGAFDSIYRGDGVLTEPRTLSGLGPFLGSQVYFGLSLEDVERFSVEAQGGPGQSASAMVRALEVFLRRTDGAISNRLDLLGTGNVFALEVPGSVNRDISIGMSNGFFDLDVASDVQVRVGGVDATAGQAIVAGPGGKGLALGSPNAVAIHSRPSATYEVVGPGPIPGPTTVPLNFNWGQTETWNAANLDLNTGARTIGPGNDRLFQDVGFLAGLDLLVTCDVATTLSTGGTQSFAIATAAATTYTVRFEWNGQVALGGTLEVNGESPGTATWTSDNPAAFTQSLGTLTPVAGETAKWFEVQFTGTGAFVEIFGSAWLLTAEDYGGGIGGIPHHVEFFTDGATETYTAVDLADHTAVLTGNMPVPASWTLVP